MRRAILSVAILLTAATSVTSQAGPPPYMPPVPYSQTSMSCGNGVIIRADGSVMIDEWTQYISSPGISTARNYPISVTLGKTLKDGTNVCLEFENGTLCVDIGKLRGVLEGLKPPAKAAEKK